MHTYVDVSVHAHISQKEAHSFYEILKGILDRLEIFPDTGNSFAGWESGKITLKVLRN